MEMFAKKVTGKISVRKKKHLSHIMRKPVLCYMRATDADQHAHLCMICVFVVCCIDTSMPIVAIYEIPRLYLVSAAEQASLSVTWSQAPEDVFLMTCLTFQYI